MDAVGAVQIIGRYALCGEIAAGGMATVHYGRLLGPAGFSRTVAIKRLHPQYAKDPEFVTMFLDEARLAARVRHPNVVSTFDVVALEGELFVVMDYVAGESLARLLRLARLREERVSARIVSAIVVGLLDGLHAAHEATDDRGDPLHIVHRDVSPQNLLVGTDGLARVVDFGIAKAAGRMQVTREGQLKGKLAYMAAEQIRGRVTRTTDVYAAAVVLWEALAGRLLFEGDEAKVLADVLGGARIDPPGQHAPELPVAVDALVLRGLERDPARRFATAREMARALERALPPASAAEVGAWVQALAGETLTERKRRIADMESDVSQVRAGAEPPEPTPSERSIEDAATALSTSTLEGRRTRGRSLRVAAAVAAALTVGLLVGGLSGGAFQRSAPGAGVARVERLPVVVAPELPESKRRSTERAPDEPATSPSATAPVRRVLPQPAKPGLDDVLDTRR
jgi:serine/threonine-protein kinase